MEQVSDKKLRFYSLELSFDIKSIINSPFNKVNSVEDITTKLFIIEENKISKKKDHK